MKSLGQMVDQLDGLTGTKDLSEWENNFVESCVTAKTNGRTLSDKRAEIVERIWKKHFV